MADEPKGLFGKYKIEKSDGSLLDPGAIYFTLRLDTDVHARRAMWAYVASCEGQHPELAADLRGLLGRIEAGLGEESAAGHKV